jgi:hypothetical protein
MDAGKTEPPLILRVFDRNDGVLYYRKPMNLRTFFVFFLVALACSTSFAGKKKKNVDAGGTLTIVEISPMSVTVDAGKDVQQDYEITGTTKATLNGLPVRPEDLRAGMIATIVLGSDNKSVVTLNAKDAPRVTKKPVKPHDNVWVSF